MVIGAAFVTTNIATSHERQSVFRAGRSIAVTRTNLHLRYAPSVVVAFVLSIGWQESHGAPM